MNDELKRLRRFILLLSAFILFLILGIVAWGSIELNRLRYIIANMDIPTVVNGIDGNDGYTPIKGVDYVDGVDSLSTRTVAYQPVYTNVPVQGEKGDKGDQGEKGEPGTQGLTVILRVNPITLLEECRILGSSVWSSVDECGVQ